MGRAVRAGIHAAVAGVCGVKAREEAAPESDFHPDKPGRIRFILYEDTLSAAVLILFLGRLILGHPGKICLILDNPRGHHSRAVRTWLEARRDWIKVFHLSAIRRN